MTKEKRINIGKYVLHFRKTFPDQVKVEPKMNQPM